MKWLLLSFYVFATLQFPLGKLISIPVHWALWALCIGLLGVQFDLRARAPTYFLAFGVLLIVSATYSTTILPIGDVVLASTSYWMMSLIFLIGLASEPLQKIDLIARINTWIAMLAVAAGVYQLYGDSVLFGLYAGTAYEQIDFWAVPRASSLFGSPQVYSAYAAFSIILYDSFLSRGRPRDFAIVGIVTVGAICAGSVAGIAAIGVYFLTKYASRHPIIWAAALPTAVILWAFLFVFQDALGISNPTNPVTRILSTVKGGLGNQERIETWIAAVQQTPPIWGNGIGSASSLVDGADRFNTESYWLNIYYEGGLVLLAAFAVLVAKLAFVRLPWPLASARTGYLVSFLFTAAVVHAFYATALPVVWLLLYGFIALGTPGHRSEQADADRLIGSRNDSTRDK